MIDACGRENLVVGDVPEHGRIPHVLQPGRVAVDDHDLLSGADEVVRARHTDAAPPADDGVTGHPADRFVHPSPSHVLAKLALDQRLEQDTERVQRCPDAGQDEGDREHLADRGQRLDLAEADRRDGGDRLVERVEDAETEHDVPDRSDDEHRAEGEQRQPDPTQLAHPLILPADAGVWSAAKDPTARVRMPEPAWPSETAWPGDRSTNSADLALPRSAVRPRGSRPKSSRCRRAGSALRRRTPRPVLFHTSGRFALRW